MSPPSPGSGRSSPRRGRDHYGVLGVARGASTAEIKAAYRALVKRHHPDAGGDDTTILALNAAWEVLGDHDRRRRYDRQLGEGGGAAGGAEGGGRRGRRARPGDDAQVTGWMRAVYAPIDRLLGQVIEPFPAELRALSADPYDDALMEAFCDFLERSRSRLERVETIFRSRACPSVIQGFGLSLYHCLGQVQDAIGELERYTMGYVDDYLHDGREMLREAGRRRDLLQQECRRLAI